MERIEYTFRLVDDVWRDVTGRGDILADILEKYGIVMDDRTQFARLYDYDEGVCYTYRAYNGAKVALSISPLTNN